MVKELTKVGSGVTTSYTFGVLICAEKQASVLIYKEGVWHYVEQNVVIILGHVLGESK